MSSETTILSITKQIQQLQAQREEMREQLEK